MHTIAGLTLPPVAKALKKGAEVTRSSWETSTASTASLDLMSTTFTWRCESIRANYDYKDLELVKKGENKKNSTILASIHWRALRSKSNWKRSKGLERMRCRPVWSMSSSLAVNWMRWSCLWRPKAITGSTERPRLWLCTATKCQARHGGLKRSPSSGWVPITRVVGRIWTINT